MILLRTTKIDASIKEFGSKLTSFSGLPLAYVVDERHGLLDTSPAPKVSVTRELCEELGLYCPADFGWRCGDYGLYLARRTYPDVRFFWMVEYDVRASDAGLRRLFSTFSEKDGIDFLASHFRASEGWNWDYTVVSRNASIHRCLFPLLRVSAPAVDHLREKRVELSRRLSRRAAWPNDESFSATTLANSGMACADLNGFGETFYTEETFSFDHPHDGSSLRIEEDDLLIYHPVLFGADYLKKVETLRSYEKSDGIGRRVQRRIIRSLNARSRW